MAARKNGDYSRAAVLLRSMLKANPDPSLVLEGQFRVGEVNYLDGNYTNAIPDLLSFISLNPKDGRVARARFFLAYCYAGQKRYPEAIAQLRLFRPLTLTLVGDTDAQIGDWLAAMDDSRSALTQYGMALQDTTLTPGARIEILNRAADLHLKLSEPGLAAQSFSNAFELATVAATRADEEYRWGLALAQANSIELALSHWQHAVNTFPRERGAFNSLVELVNRNAPVDNFQRGLIDYYARSYDAAISAFAQALNINDTPSVRNYLALAYEGNGNAASALAEWNSIVASYPNNVVAIDAAYNRPRALGALGRVDEAVAAFRNFAATYPTDERADDSLMSAARLLSQQNRNAESALQYSEVQNKFPNGNRAAEALWNAGLEYYRAADPKTAGTTWQTLNSTYPAASQKQGSLYWLGKTSKMRGDETGAKEFWSQAASLPGSYYGWRAMDQLKSNPISSNVKFVPDVSPAARAQAEKWLISWTPALSTTKNLAALGPQIESNMNFRRAVELQSLDRVVEARTDFEALNLSLQNDPHSLYSLSLYYSDHDLESLALRSARRLADISPTRDFRQLPRLIKQLIYPAAYSDLILAEAKTYSLDPALLFGMIRQESGFNPAATSSAVARGLTQVIPSTGQGIANQLGVRNYTFADLYRPVISVHFGAYYLSQNMRAFDGNMFYALMAYNGGPGNAAKWRNDDVDLAVENITLTETAAYIRAVYSQFRQYQIVYGE